MSRDIITIDTAAIIERLDHGKRWMTGWGDYASADGATCLHGAVRYCQPADAPIIEQVGARFGFGTRDNDSADGWLAIESMILAHPTITDDMLLVTFGPQWGSIVALVQRCHTLTPDEVQKLAAAWAASRAAAWAAARDAAWAAAGDRAAAGAAAWVAAWAAASNRAAAGAAAWVAAGVAARAAATRDLIGQHGYTQAHYDLLTRPWATVIGPVHPDDEPVAP